jgi:hypothetical protein
MKAGQFLTADYNGNSIVISANTLHVNANIGFVGASCTASVMPFTLGVLQSIQLSVEKGRREFVALEIKNAVRSGKGGSYYDHYLFLIPIVWKNEKLFANLDEEFVSSSGCLIQLTEELDISITTGEQRFSTCRNGWGDEQCPAFVSKKKKLIDCGYRIVNNPNLLCQFAVGKISLKALEESASPDGRSTAEIERDELRSQLMKSSAIIAEQSGENNLLRFHLAESSAENNKHLGTITELAGEVNRQSTAGLEAKKHFEKVLAEAKQLNEENSILKETLDRTANNMDKRIEINRIFAKGMDEIKKILRAGWPFGKIGKVDKVLKKIYDEIDKS